MSINLQIYFKIIEIHTFAKDYLLSWLPKLPSNQTFNTRLNMLSEIFKVLIQHMIESFRPEVRHPIKSFFNWLNEKTEIQRASKVRATKGLLVHIFGKLAVVLLSFVCF